MIGIDTNVVIRFLTQDDEVQSPVATRLLTRLTREKQGFISLVVLAEIVWVLSSAYEYSRDQIANAVENVLRTGELIVENRDAAYRALALYHASNSGDFADALIGQISFLAGASETVTFDRKAAIAFNMRLMG